MEEKYTLMRIITHRCAEVLLSPSPFSPYLFLPFSPQNGRPQSVPFIADCTAGSLYYIIAHNGDHTRSSQGCLNNTDQRQIDKTPCMSHFTEDKIEVKHSCDMPPAPEMLALDHIGLWCWPRGETPLCGLEGSFQKSPAPESTPDKPGLELEEVCQAPGRLWGMRRCPSPVPV